jgi:hypothetical protein
MNGALQQLAHWPPRLWTDEELWRAAAGVLLGADVGASAGEVADELERRDRLSAHERIEDAKARRAARAGGASC